MVTEPTRGDNILDLFITDNPTFVQKVNILPGIADHDIVYAKVNIRPQVTKQKPRIMYLYKKANWDEFKHHISAFKDPFLSGQENKSVNSLTCRKEKYPP